MAIGAITNVALAIKKEPKIIEKIEVVWLGGHSLLQDNNLEQFELYKSKIDFSVYKVDETLKEQFIQAVMDGFSGDNPEDPYESLSDGYKIALEKSFNENNSEYKVIHYLGKKEKEAISTATIVYKKDKAIIYNVTTNKKYQKNGVCRQMMSDIIKDLIKLNINN